MLNFRPTGMKRNSTQLCFVAAGYEPSGFVSFTNHSPDSLRRSSNNVSTIRMKSHLYPYLLILLPSPCTWGEGLGVRDFALYFDWCFDREFSV